MTSFSIPLGEEGPGHSHQDLCVHDRGRIRPTADGREVSGRGPDYTGVSTVTREPSASAVPPETRPPPASSTWGLGIVSFPLRLRVGDRALRVTRRPQPCPPPRPARG